MKISFGEMIIALAILSSFAKWIYFSILLTPVCLSQSNLSLHSYIFKSENLSLTFAIKFPSPPSPSGIREGVEGEISNILVRLSSRYIHLIPKSCLSHPLDGLALVAPLCLIFSRFLFKIILFG